MAIKVPKALSSTHSIFIDNRWGNPLNAGKHYERPYSKTRSSAERFNKTGFTGR